VDLQPGVSTRAGDAFWHKTAREFRAQPFILPVLLDLQQARGHRDASSAALALAIDDVALASDALALDSAAVALASVALVVRHR